MPCSVPDASSHGAVLEIITGDSPSALLASLDDVLTTAPLPPFDDDIVVVQSLGMERWVRQQLARRRGCAASLRIPFPAAFCRSLAEDLQPLQTIDARFDEEALTWRLFTLLENDALMQEVVFEPLRQFLSSSDPVKRYGLARRISARFDEYRLYRPHWLLDWEADEDEGGGRAHVAPDLAHAAWQRALWRRLVEGHGPQPLHFARWFLQTIERLEQASAAPAGLPARLSVFGVSTLPPLFIRLLQAVARFVPVRFYVLVPDGESWRSGANRSPLFEQFGHASRELLELLTTSHVGAISSHQVLETRQSTVCTQRHLEAVRRPGQKLLHRLQEALRSPSEIADGLPVAADDRSVSVHVCHSPLREMEVLRDHVLDAFAADPSLRPHDILVMVPDVERYAPLAASVLGEAVSGQRAGIPFRVADRALARESAPLQAFELILDLVTSRLPASDILRLLALAPVRRSVGISAAQAEHIGAWVQRAGVCWGWDAEDRATRQALPAFEENSWRVGLDRLLLGYAAGPVETLIHGQLPVAGDLVGESDLLGVFIEWVEHLEVHLRVLRTPHTLAEWPAVLESAFTWAVQPDGVAERRTAEEILEGIRALSRGFSGSTRTGTAHPADAAPVSPRQVPYGEVRDGPESAVVDFAVVRHWLTVMLKSQDHATGFLSGGLTLCAMKPMRAIPHRVIAMLGLDDRSFPRREKRPAFDLIGSHREPGDRDPRSDDRQLMLDTILSAEDRLHISYVGRSQTNNSEIAPSIVVAELLHTVEKLAQIQDGHRHPLLRVEHRLQAFSRSYFTPSAADPSSPLFSYDAPLAHSLSVAGEALVERPFVDEDFLPAVGMAAAAVVSRPERLEIALDDLVAAWCNPSQFHAQHVLQISLRDTQEQVPDVEPMTVDKLLGTRVQQRMLEDILHRRVSADSRRALVEASGELPPGPLGEAWYERLVRRMAPLVAHVGAPEFLEPLTVNVEGAAWQLVGRLDFQRPDEQWHVRAAACKPKDLVRAWIAHLARAAMGGKGPTRVLALDAVSWFNPFGSSSEPMAVLELLVGHYRRVLSRPVPYFLNASHAYRHALNSKRGSTPPLSAARAAYGPGGEYRKGDVDDPYVALLWRGRDPFEAHAEEFISLTDAFWGPVEAALVAGTLGEAEGGNS